MAEDRKPFPEWAAAGLVALVTAAVFLPGLGHEFVNWDDEKNFTDNPHYRGLGGEQLRWMFTTFHMGHYQPLAWVTLAVDHAVWGMNPAGYHLTSLLIHAANAALIFLVLLRLLPAMGGRPEGHRWIAAVAALFYSIHPLRVESVSWVTERRDVLCGLFLLLSLLAYLRMVREPEGTAGRRKWLAWSLAGFAASLLSKSLGIFYPLALVALDFCPLRRMEPGRRSRTLIEKAPFLLVAAVDGIVMLQAMTHIQAVRTLASYDLAERVMQAAYGLCFYVWKTLVPVSLSPLYLIENPMNPWAPKYLGAAAAVAGGAAALWGIRRRCPGAAAAAAAYAVLVAPVLGLVVTGRQVVADRYTYVSCLPWTLLLAAGLARVPRALPAAGAVAAAFAALAVVQVAIWKDSFTLWDHAARLDPDNHVAFADRGIARAIRGDSEGAMRDFDRALTLEPKDSQTWRNRGLTRHLARDYAGAVSDYSASLDLAPGMASTWLARADARLAAGDFRGALDDYSRSQQLQPTEQAAAGRARVFAVLGEAVGRDPGNARTWLLRGDLRRRQGDLRGAVEDYDQAVARDPGFGRGFAARGLAKAASGDARGAVADFTRAIELGSDLVESHANRAYQRLRLGDRAGAVADFEAAIRLAPPGPLRASLESDLARQRGGP